MYYQQAWAIKYNAEHNIRCGIDAVVLRQPCSASSSAVQRDVDSHVKRPLALVQLNGTPTMCVLKHAGG